MTRLVAIVWRALSARSPTFASNAKNVTDILEFGRVSPNISRARQTKYPFANVNDVARRVHGS